jgi:hypothetical protein
VRSCSAAARRRWRRGAGVRRGRGFGWRNDAGRGMRPDGRASLAAASRRAAARLRCCTRALRYRRASAGSRACRAQRAARAASRTSLGDSGERSRPGRGAKSPRSLGCNNAARCCNMLRNPRVTCCALLFSPVRHVATLDGVWRVPNACCMLYDACGVSSSYPPSHYGGGAILSTGNLCTLISHLRGCNFNTVCCPRDMLYREHHAAVLHAVFHMCCCCGHEAH